MIDAQLIKSTNNSIWELFFIHFKLEIVFPASAIPASAIPVSNEWKILKYNSTVQGFLQSRLNGISLEMTEHFTDCTIV